MASLIQDKYGASKVGLMISVAAKRIKEVISVDNWNSATESQLKARDKVHNNIMILLEADVDIEKATNLALSKIKEN